jgi:uncharacterized coiled-coil DUF342 family protein
MTPDEAAKLVERHAEWLTQWALAADTDVQMREEQATAEALRILLVERVRLRETRETSVGLLAEQRDAAEARLREVEAERDALLVQRDVNCQYLDGVIAERDALREALPEIMAVLLDPTLNEML